MARLRRPGQLAAKVRLGLTLGYLTWLGLGAGAWAQGPVDSALRGVVEDQSGHPLWGAKITLRRTDGGPERTTEADRNGRFLLTHIEPGTYVLAASSFGYVKGWLPGLRLALGETAELDLSLSGSLDATADVVGELDQAVRQSVISPEDLELLPIDGPQWRSSARTLPGVEPDTDDDGLISLRGLASIETASVVDGVSAMQSFGSVPVGTGAAAQENDTDAVESGSSGAGLVGLARGRSAGASTSFAGEAIREFRIAGTGFSALTGHAGGGVITTVTKSGTSTLHGSGFLVIRSSALAATNPLSVVTSYVGGVATSGLAKPLDLRQTFGGSIGGPILPRKLRNLFYFSAYDQQKRNFPAISSPGYASFYTLTPMQSALLSTRGVSAAHTSAALSYLDSLSGSIPRRQDETIYFGRLDWRHSQRQSFALEYNHVRWNSPAGAVSAPVVARGRASLGDSLGSLDSGIGRVSTTIGHGLSNDLRIQISRDLQYERPQPNLPQEPQIGPGGLAPEVTIGPLGLLFGTPASLSQLAYPDETRDQLADTLTFGRARHILQLGADLSLIHDQVSTLPNAEGTFNYDSSLINGHAGGLVDWITDYTFGVHAYPNGACPSINAADHLFCFHSFTQSFGVQTVAFATRELSAFLEDSWHPRSGLTIHLGARYELEVLPQPQQPNPSLDAVFSATGATSKFPQDRNNGGPRGGVSWAPFGAGRGVLRLGYGMYFGRLAGTTVRSALIDTAVAGSTTQIRITPATETACPQVANQGFGYPCAYTSQPPAAVANTSSAMLFDKRFQLPVVQQASLGLAGEIKRITLSLTYTMNLDTQLMGSTDINIAPSSATSKFQLQGGTGKIGVVSGESFVVPVYRARISTLWGPVTDIKSDVNGTYNGITAVIEHRTGRALTLRANYTFSKAIDYGQNESGIPRTNAQFDPFTIRYDKALSALNYPRTLHALATFQTHVSRDNWAHLIASGWALAPIVTWRSGRPYTLQIHGGTSLTGGRESINGSGGATYLPTVGPNTLQLPMAFDTDLRFARTFTLKRDDRLRLRLSAEAFNLTNHVNLSSVSQRAFLVGTQPTGSIVIPLIFQDAPTVASEGLNTPPFGTPTAAATSLTRERQLQFGLRLDF